MGSVHYCRMVIRTWLVLQTLHRLVPIQDSYPYNNIYLVPYYYLIKSTLLYDVLSSDTSHTSTTMRNIFTECEVSTESMCSHPVEGPILHGLGTFIGKTYWLHY